MERKVICVLAMVLMLALSSLAQSQEGKTNPLVSYWPRLTLGPRGCWELVLSASFSMCSQWSGPLKAVTFTRTWIDGAVGGAPGPMRIQEE